MPLVHSENIDGDTTYYLWKLEETEEQLRSQLGVKYNMDELETVSHPQKIREWLASRLVIQRLMSTHNEPYLGTKKDEHGKAFLVNHSFYISLTHTLDYVAVVINPVASVGIDMEKIAPKLASTSKKYLSEEEDRDANGDLPTLCVYWCAKEALYKLYGKRGISFKQAISLSSFKAGNTLLTGELVDGSNKIESKLHIRWFGNYCLVVAV